jgi:predicted glycosyltransferase involved in capsule biosynthesis
MKLTLITPYRERLKHLMNQLLWWDQYSGKQGVEWLVIELTPEPSLALQDILHSHQVGYLHLPCEGAFHKTKALNLGLKQAQGQWIAAFDVDLLPWRETFSRHIWLAQQSPSCVITGYRLMAVTETVDLETLQLPSLEAFALAPEDQPTALRKHLLQGERFGVMPLLRRDRLLEIHGWDEFFLGWGAEDQDLMERYLTPEIALCRCPELIYLHLHHEPVDNWNTPDLIQRNRDYYYRLRSGHNP